MALRVTSEEVINSPGAAWPGYLEKCLCVGLTVYHGVTGLSRCCRPPPIGLAQHPYPNILMGYLSTLMPIPQQAVTPIHSRLLQHPDPLTPVGYCNTLTSLSATQNRVFRSYSSGVWDAWSTVSLSDELQGGRSIPEHLLGFLNSKTNHVLQCVCLTVSNPM